MACRMTLLLSLSSNLHLRRIERREAESSQRAAVTPQARARLARSGTYTADAVSTLCAVDAVAAASMTPPPRHTSPS